MEFSSSRNGAPGNAPETPPTRVETVSVADAMPTPTQIEKAMSGPAASTPAAVPEKLRAAVAVRAVSARTLRVAAGGGGVAQRPRAVSAEPARACAPA